MPHGLGGNDLIGLSQTVPVERRRLLFPYSMRFWNAIRNKDIHVHLYFLLWCFPKHGSLQC